MYRRTTKNKNGDRAFAYANEVRNFDRCCRRHSIDIRTLIGAEEAARPCPREKVEENTGTQVIQIKISPRLECQRHTQMVT